MTEVAQAAGVSVKTVSRVLNDEPFVTTPKRQRVLAAAGQLNYRVNPAARSLRRDVKPVVLAVDHTDRSSYLESLQLGAFKACQQHSLPLFLDVWTSQAADCAASVERNRPAGVILVPPLCDNLEVLAILRAHDVPCARIAPARADPHCLTVFLDDRAAARAMTEHLIGLGHRRIGFITGRAGHDAAAARLDGYGAALIAAGLPVDADLIRPGDFLYATSLDSAELLLALPERPTAVFASNDEMAAAVLTVAYRLGIKVPDDLSVVGFDDAPIAAVVTPNLTTVHQPIEQMAHTAVRLLAEQANPVLPDVSHVQLDFMLVHRGSAAAASCGEGKEV